eukprot:720705-Ditylum_brightwellii.AAC.1
MLLLSATSILILVGRAMLAIVTTNKDFTFDSDSTWIAWTYVTNPGTHADAEGTAVRFVSFFITIGGMLRKSRVIESNHTLMLGWSDKSLAIIEQIALANESGKLLLEKMPNIIHKASENVVQRIGSTQSSSTVTTPSLQLTEPQ